MLRATFFTSLLITTGACAQTLSVDAPAGSAKEQAKLPSSVLGTWVPYGRIYEQWGNLSIGPDALTWYNCVQAPYRVLQAEGRTFLIQLLHSPPCRFVADANFLVLNSSDDEIDVAVCHEKPEFSHPLARGRCSSRGVLYKDKRSQSGSEPPENTVIQYAAIRTAGHCTEVMIAAASLAGLAGRSLDSVHMEQGIQKRFRLAGYSAL